MVDPAAFRPFNLGDILAQSQQARMQQAQLRAFEGQEQRRQQLGDLLPAAMHGDAKALSGVFSADPAVGMQLEQRQREQLAQRWQRTAPHAYRARQLPAEQRQAYFQQIAPQLRALGWSDEDLSHVDLSDQGLDALITSGETLEQAREQDSIHWQIIPQVGAFATNGMGRPVSPGMAPTPGAAPQAAQPAQQAPAQPTAPSNPYAAGVASTLSQAGIPAPVVAGFLGNGHHESAGWNIGRPGDGGTSLGAFQWRGERAANFRQVTGADPRTATPEQTARFILWELQHPEQAGMTREQAQEILSAPTPEQAALLVSRYYERPNRALAHDDRRVALARQYAGTQTAQAGPAPGSPLSLQDQAATGQILAPPRPGEGMRFNPDGSVSPIPGSQQEFQRGESARDDARQNRQNINQVINTYRTDPDVRKWRAARTATTQLQSLGSSGSATDDIAIVYTFMKALDSISAVREGEFDVAQNSAGLRQRGEAYLAQLRQGTRLTPGQRREMVLTAQRMYIDLSRVYNDQAQSYREQAIATGMSPQEAARQFPLARGPRTFDESQRRRNQSQQQRGSGRASNGVTWRVVQ